MAFKAPLYHTHWRKPTLKTPQSIVIKFHLQSMDCRQCLALRSLMGSDATSRTDRRKVNRANRIGERPVRVVRSSQHTSLKKVPTLFSVYELWFAGDSSWKTVIFFTKGTSKYTRKCCPATALSSLQKRISKLKDHLIIIDPRSLASCPYVTPLFSGRWNKKHCRSTSRDMRTISTYGKIGLPHKSPS